jgi:8-oxo-dGTP pyrophosphatase MutT (NUDIX family)
MRAAGTLVIWDGKVLAFRRAGETGLSLPCGKIEDGESDKEAAVRETYEETGYLVQVEDKPFVGFDNVDKNEVVTYRAEIIGGEQIKAENEYMEYLEGLPVWANPKELTVGPFAEYNTEVLQYFGIEV